MYYYAEINEKNMCFAVSDLAEIINLPYLIPLDSYDISLLGKIYDNGIWRDKKNDEEITNQTGQ